MKATEQYSHVVLLIILYKMVLPFEYENGNILTVTIQIKATEQYFPVVQGNECKKRTDIAEKSLNESFTRKLFLNSFRDRRSWCWDKSITFLWLYSLYHMVYLPTFSESNASDFYLVMTWISGIVPATSEDWCQLSEDFRTLPQNVRRCSEDVWALPKLLKRRQF